MEKKIEYVGIGPCRFCSTNGRHRDVMREYQHYGASEVYSEMFLDCFNLFLSSSSQASTLICSTCVAKLRSASKFKNMVVAAELKLLDALDTDSTFFFNEPKEDDIAEIKAEVTVKNELDTQVTDSLEVTDSMEFQDDGILDYRELNSDDDFVEGEAELLARFSSEALMPLPTRMSLYDTSIKYVRHLDALKGKVIKAADISKLLRETSGSQKFVKKSYQSEKITLINNMSLIIKYSNVTPFKSKKRSGFPCFYCSFLHETLSSLQEHQEAKHKRTDTKRTLSKYGSESLLLYVDVTNLQCTICNQAIPNLNELKSHLIKVHEKKICTDIPDRIIPFKIGTEDFGVCQVCGFNFETFGAVERHMNVHFRNYLCKECGSGYVTKLRLKVHSKSMHSEGNYPCEICNKVFKNQQKHKSHVDHVHKMIKRFKCLKCPERFTEYFRRQKHMVYVHGVAPISYKCNVCDRSFQIRYALSRHMKRDHLEEKNYQCEVCSYKCFSNNELREHMIKHNGERVHECSICKKAYARKKTLREHMRIHSNDRRFACVVCGQAFIQKCSLKGHIKTHHLEYSAEHKI